MKAKSSHYTVNPGILAVYSQAVSHFLETYLIVDIMTEADGEMACYVRLSSMSPLELSSEPWLKTLSGRYNYDQYVLEKIPQRDSALYCETVSLQKLSYPAISLN